MLLLALFLWLLVDLVGVQVTLKRDEMLVLLVLLALLSRLGDMWTVAGV